LLYTHHYYIRSEQLLSLLLKMFDSPQSFISKEENFEHYQMQEIIDDTKNNILQLVNEWISTPFLDFKSNENLLLISHQFFNKISSPKTNKKLGVYEKSYESLLLSIKKTVIIFFFQIFTFNIFQKFFKIKSADRLKFMKTEN
jgi:hypothetical protein